MPHRKPHRTVLGFSPYGQRLDSLLGNNPTPDDGASQFLGCARTWRAEGNVEDEYFYLRRSGGCWQLFGNQRLLGTVLIERLVDDPVEAGERLLSELWSLRHPSEARLTGTRDPGALGPGAWQRLQNQYTQELNRIWPGHNFTCRSLCS